VIRFIAGRFLQMIIALLLMSMIVFFLARLTGDPTSLLVSEYATTQDIAALKVKLGFDRPIYVQYARFLINAIHGDFGRSLKDNSPVMELIFDRAAATMQLCGTAFLLAVFLGIAGGVLAAIRHGTYIDNVIRTLALLGQSAPPFVMAILFILFFGVQLRILPTSGYGGIRHLVLPSVSLSLYFIASIMRLQRGSMLDVLGKEYIKLVRIKGIRERVVIWKHALKNSIIPVITYVVPLTVIMIGGAVAVETVFGWPGMGQLAYQAAIGRDYPVVQAIILLLSAALMVANFIADNLYGYIDPRIRFVKY
jgi:peptide/nickel transport system permease protein